MNHSPQPTLQPRPPQPKTILVVDDSTNIRAMVAGYLEGEGYRVLCAVDGREALEIARRDPPDLILLDLMMPQVDGYSFLRAYRLEGDAPVIILTAKLEEVDKVLGLELGADDYVTKPFGMRELTARIRAVLRRAEKAPPAASVLRGADIVLDLDGHQVTVGERRVELTPSEFSLLAALLTAPGRVFSRLDLLARLQGSVYEGYERTIDVHVRNLRLKIEPDPREPRYIETVYGVGYRFAG
jgi:two-component system alkaline phosphatase synthesis response regulator PhoP